MGLPAETALVFGDRRLGQLDKAIDDASKAIALDTASVPAYLDRGIAYYAAKRYDLAIADFSKVIALKPDYVAAYNDRGNAHDDSGDHDAAIADYSHALVLKPDYADAYARACGHL